MKVNFLAAASKKMPAIEFWLLENQLEEALLMSDFRKALFYFIVSQQTQSETIAHMFMSWQNMIENKEFQTSVSLRFAVPKQ